MSQCTAFGCGTLMVTFSEPDGAPICGPALPVTRIRGEYTTDDTSFAQVEIEGTCCDICPDLRPLYHEINIWRDGQRVWWGPIPPSGIFTAEGLTIVEAADRSFWHLNQREPNTTNQTGQPETLANQMWEHIDPDHPGQAPAFITTNADFTADIETVQGEETFRAYEILARDAIDWSTIGDRTYIGAPHIDPGLPILELSDATLVGSAGRGFTGTGITSASILSSDEDGEDVEIRGEVDAGVVPWTLHTSENDSAVVEPGIAAAALLDPFPQRSLVVDAAQLSDIAGECDLTRLIPGRRVLVSDSCGGESSDQIIESVAFEWVRGEDGNPDEEYVSIGTIAPSTALF